MDSFADPEDQAQLTSVVAPDGSASVRLVERAGRERAVLTLRDEGLAAHS